ncbi:hypothetical protein FHS95_000559 [Sphingomonas naasensis]|uniref:Uncharacterized protein n=1 Tax=Sphingomonas naasensis TaxID=1344951 RepID=A0A4S1WRU7_9SPHN|nr:hypothetical protein [Sphingomonas naasensis]NIJ18890.1 hypothetical protein [Sphingomonas naasensis]TGX46111.1 hypothetical protein E5A74_02800 [Sphingomonas naasensis]
MGETSNDAELRGPITGEADDPRSDLEQAVQSRADEADAAGGGGTESPLEPTGIPDGVGGTAGEVKNQDRTQQ